MKKSIRFTLLGLCLAVCAWTGWEMIDRGNHNLLWGYRPFFFFLALWGVITFIRLHRFAKDPGGLRWLGLSTLSGVLLGIGFPDIIPVPFLMFIGFVPLLIIEKEVAGHFEKAKRRKILGIPSTLL